MNIFKLLTPTGAKPLPHLEQQEYGRSRAGIKLLMQHCLKSCYFSLPLLTFGIVLSGLMAKSVVAKKPFESHITTPIFAEPERGTGGLGSFFLYAQAISDYGDAPSNYNNGDNGEHRTTINSELHFGTVPPDGEASPQNSASADGDDNAGDDEDGITSFPTLDTSTNNYSLTATVNNSSSSAANIYGWIDFDRDGEFDQDERASVANGTINLDTDGKVPAGSSGTVTLNWTGIGDPGANIINGTSYVRVRVTTDDLAAPGQSTIRDSASVNQASNGEIEDFPLTINFSPLAEQSFCESIGGTVNTNNLFTELNNGTFGNGTNENQSSSINPDLTTYIFNGSYPPRDGEYTVSTRRTDVGFGTWHTMTGHTTGDATDRFMVINADENVANTEMIQSRYISGLTPNTNYTFTAFILNTVEVNPTAHIDPNVSYGIDLEGIDDNGNGIIDEDQEIEVRFSSGNIPESSQPTWVPYSFLFNTGDATSARFIIRNNVIGGFGNDLAIDDITLRGCDLNTGNLSGTLYYDTNSNDSFDAGEPGLPPGLTVRLIDDQGTADTDDDVIVTRLANPGGTFSFINIPTGNNYRLEAPLDDGSGNSIGTTNPLTNITVTANATTANLNFGYEGAGDDYGDAPIDYDDTAENDIIDGGDNPARHSVSSNLYLGAIAADADTPPLNSTDANQDDTNATDDEDAFTTPPDIPLTGTYNLNVPVHNTSGSNATLHAWIDFDQDGKFTSGEYQSAAVNINSTSASLSWAIPSGLTPNASTYARFRLTTDNLSDDGSTTNLDERAVGAADDGEVEDYQLTMADDTPSLCPNARADLWFANDESGSVENDEFDDSLDFIYQVSDQFEYGEAAGMKAGIIGWAASSPTSSNHIIIPITDTFGDPDDTGLINDTDNVNTINIDDDNQGVREEYTAKVVASNDTGTRLDRATNYLADIITTANGRRDNTPQIAIILTDANESQITISFNDGTSRWEAAARNLKDSDDGPGASIILIIIDEAAAAYNAGGDAREIIDNVVGSNGRLLVVPSYQEAADATEEHITLAAQAVCDSTTPIATDPELLLTKRITAINPEQPDEVSFTDFVDDSSSADNHANWPNSSGDSGDFSNTYTVGATDGGQVLPDDIVEYTIYFLSSGDAAANNVLVCDLIPTNTELVTNAFDIVTPAPDGTAGLERGLAIEYNGNLESLTNDQDGDRGYYFPPGVEPSTVFPNVKCSDSNQPNDNGAIVVNLGDVPRATASGEPIGSYGFIRFRARVK